jgi:hypothetical protein
MYAFQILTLTYLLMSVHCQVNCCFDAINFAIPALTYIEVWIFESGYD